MCPKSVLRLILWISAHIFQAKRLHSEYNYSIFTLEMVDSHQWRISFFFVLTRCRRFQILVTNIGPNDLKLILYIEETSLYKVILSIIITVLLFSCGSTAKSAKLLQGWHFFLVVYSLPVSRKCYISLT